MKRITTNARKKNQPSVGKYLAGHQVLTVEQQKNLIAVKFREVMEIMGLNLNDPSLKDTPSRVARMYVDELCASLHSTPPPFTTFDAAGSKQMVVVKDIEVISICEHHWMPIIGKAHIGYIPDKLIAGLSKFNRTVKYFSQKPQLQERLSDEIGKYLEQQLGTKDVTVIIKAKHHCCASRGVRDPNSDTVTSFVSGKFYQPAVRNEFLQLLQL